VTGYRLATVLQYVDPVVRENTVKIENHEVDTRHF
jgi:hypothetical protein